MEAGTTRQSIMGMRPTLIMRIALLSCGIISSLLYAAMNVFVAMQYEGYHSASQTVSELSAIDAPTRSLWVSLAIPYSLLVIAFGVGLWNSAHRNRQLRIVAAIIMINAFIGFFWPPMHQREVLAAGGGTLTDTLHIVFTTITVPLFLLAIGFGAAACGKAFRIYSIVTMAVLIVFGVLTGLDSPRMEADLPTPWMGVWERISIGAYMLWMIVLAIVLIQETRRKGSLTQVTNEPVRSKLVVGNTRLQ